MTMISTKRYLYHLCAPLLLAVLFMVAIPAAAQVLHDSLPELRNIDVVEHLGEQIPLDTRLVNDRGDTVTLAKYFGQGKPVVMVMGYYNCPMLCQMVLNGLSDGLRTVPWEPGGDYLLLNVSINPRETYELAAAKKRNYLEYFRRDNAADGWHFFVGPEEQTRSLAEALGFRYYYDEARQEYAHAAVAFILSPDGVISRYLYGLTFKANDLKLAILEASEGKIGNTIDRIILYCYHFDPDAKGYVVFASNIMKLGGLLSLILLFIFLTILWLKDRKRSFAKKQDEMQGAKAGGR